MRKDSWESSADWYDKIVGEKGHYYHEHLILPKTLMLLKFGPQSSLLDLACGQGVFARAIPKQIDYTGVDISPALIKAAKQLTPAGKRQFFIGDVTKPLPVKQRDFSHAICILALQNISDPLAALKNGAAHLKKGGRFCLVLNHPCFRIPRQSSWGIDSAKKLQYRRLDHYFTPLEIPISTHPGKGESTSTISYHHPLSQYVSWLVEAGFAIVALEEWCSDKKSTGAAAKMENRARREFPLFLAVLAEKI